MDWDFHRDLILVIPRTKGNQQFNIPNSRFAPGSPVVFGPDFLHRYNNCHATGKRWIDGVAAEQTAERIVVRKTRDNPDFFFPAVRLGNLLVQINTNPSFSGSQPRICCSKANHNPDHTR